jgi:hypothetical protein
MPKKSNNKGVEAFFCKIQLLVVSSSTSSQAELATEVVQECKMGEVKEFGLSCTVD